jgi:butyryl-CoA dehydrogenase
MDFEYTEAQKQIRTMVRDFAVNEVAPGAEERDRTGEFDYSLWKKMGNLGIIGIKLPLEVGGSGDSLLSLCLAVEEISRVDMSLGVTLLVAEGAAHAILDHSLTTNHSWIDNYIRPIIAGDAFGCTAITEAEAGSDTAAIQTHAKPDGNSWVINGSKVFITNAGLKNCLFVSPVLLTDPATKEFSLILVPTGTPGYSIMPKYRKMGWRSSDTRELHFDDCRVPQANLVGERGAGRKKVIREGFSHVRTISASSALGLHQACIDESLKYAKERVLFGKPIGKKQFIQQMVCEMVLEAEMGRLLRDNAAKMAELFELGSSQLMYWSSLAKWFCCDAANRAAYSAVQIYGGLGVMDECPVSRYYRDIRTWTIGDGSAEIQKTIIAREIGL